MVKGQKRFGVMHLKEFTQSNHWQFFTSVVYSKIGLKVEKYSKTTDGNHLGSYNQSKPRFYLRYRKIIAI